jgi:hypothetical protein
LNKSNAAQPNFYPKIDSEYVLDVANGHILAEKVQKTLIFLVKFPKTQKKIFISTKLSRFLVGYESR